MVRTRILQPYTRVVDDTRHRTTKVVVIGLMLFVAILMGFLFAILPMTFVSIPLVPVIVLFFLMLWVAPDVDLKVDRAVCTLFLAFLVTLTMWPDYISVAIPGIGWLSPARIAFLLLTFVSLAGIATSPRIRGLIMDIMRAANPIWLLFLSFFILQFILAFATLHFHSRWFLAQFMWYYAFIIAAWVFYHEGMTRRLFQILIIALAWQGFWVFFEPGNGGPIWGDYIPEILKGDPELVNKIMTGRNRTGMTGIRAKSIYLTSLTYAEFLSLAMPFVLHAVIYARKAIWQVAAALLYAMILANCWLNDQRTAWIGVILSLMLTIATFGFRRFLQLRQKRDLVGPTIVWMYPIGAMVVLASMLFVPRIRYMTLGGAEHQFSNNARERMWEMAIDRLMVNPLGYGPFKAAGVVGYQNRAGNTTIDSFYINLLVDYGVVGFLLFAAFCIGLTVLALRTYFRAETEEEALAAPLAISMVTFMVVKSVLSQAENHDLVFAMGGAVMALNYRQMKRLAAAAAPPDPVAAPAAPVAPLPPPRPRGAPVLAYGRTA